MNNNLFRKKNMERIASPEQLDDYIHVSNPSAWVVLSAFVVLLIGVCIWGIFGKLDTTISVVAVKDTDGVVCYIKETDRPKIEVGMLVKIQETEFSVTGIEKNPILVGSSMQEYAKHVGNLNDGEWVYCVYTDGSIGSDGQVFPAEIVIERINPLYFVIN